ncbi:filamentous hemagglutinin N-terminal domain-containing protein [Nostoc flagelliforme FACHB-838]|uniref:Filamentous hemagglutinin N-terminal domain-containing protein n=1 Tax=Nostoc flagelliforme FACHB-838 TaxID=2692904 RepID=A0ABR8E4S8_9NOSO|nr:filamentous hemagglutinin N-terminal domain-containing protein [Nostoc flagelliforme FACHB-838]
MLFKNRSVWDWHLRLLSSLLSSGIFVSSGCCVLAQIKEDSTLGAENSIVTPQVIDGQFGNQIDGGAIRGTNLFHSFEQFSVLKGSTAYFNNAANIQNIISRVTGRSISNIDGIIKANPTANLFLINPNGIIFGPNASLQIGGSFVASTASSLNFADGIKFSATEPQTTPLLTVSVPVGLQFGATAATIGNQSQAKANDTAVGLQVLPNKTLAFVGGDILLEGGNLTAKGGRIELGSVADNSVVSLNSTDQGWFLGYEGVNNFQNIKLIRRDNIRSYIDASGEGGGDIQVQGKNVQVTGTGGSSIFTNASNMQLRGNLTITASDSVELIGGIPLRVGSMNGGVAGNLTITTGRLIVKDGAQVLVDNSNSVSDSVPQLTVNASDSVELSGGSIGASNSFRSSGLFTATYGVGNAGNITINTPRLNIQGGAQVSTKSDGRSLNGVFYPATGKGGNLTVNASEFIKLSGISANGSTPSSLSASTNASGSAGDLNLFTGQLIIRDGALVTVSSQPRDIIYAEGAINLGQAGDINVTVRSILLDEGKLTSNSELGKGGNITLNVRDLLLMRRESQISTNAETPQARGDGGDITINASSGFIVAPPLDNNDITANAFSGSGGNITITAKNIFGFVQRTRADLVKLLNTEDVNQLKPNELLTNDITAFSQQNPLLNGTVQINSPDADPSKGLAELPVNVVDASQQIVADCNSGRKIERSSLIVTGRGGMVADPTQPLISDDAVLADWITLSPEAQARANNGIHNRPIVHKQPNTEAKLQEINSINESTQIVEAQGWVIDANGDVVFVAQVPTATPNNSLLTDTSCVAH